MSIDSAITFGRDRDANGRLLPGHQCPGPGRPRRGEERYSDCLRRAISADDIEAVFRKVCEKARKGDLAAARLLLSYSVGLPIDSSLEGRLTEIESRVQNKSA